MSERDFCAPCIATDKAEPAFTTVSGTRMCPQCAKETFELGVALLPVATPEQPSVDGPVAPPGPVGPSAARAFNERYKNADEDLYR